MTQLPSRLELIKKTFFFCTKAPYARMPLSKPQHLAFVGWPLLLPTSELHILEGKKNHQTSGGFLSELSPALSPCQLPAFFFQLSLCNRFDDYPSCISSPEFQLDVTYKPELLFCSTVLLSATHSFSCP